MGKKSAGKKKKDAGENYAHKITKHPGVSNLLVRKLENTGTHLASVTLNNGSVGAHGPDEATAMKNLAVALGIT